MKRENLKEANAIEKQLTELENLSGELLRGDYLIGLKVPGVSPFKWYEPFSGSPDPTNEIALRFINDLAAEYQRQRKELSKRLEQL